MRQKDLGIWQTWTWCQVLEIVRAYAVGLNRLGLKRGETIAIVGANRPKLYWSVMAAQMLGAMPVPVYADAVADELAFVLAHADVRFAAVEDQEQIDKIMSVMGTPAQARGDGLRRAARLPRLRPQPPAFRLTTSSRRGARRCRRSGGRAPWLDAEIAAGQGLRSVHHSLHLRHHRHVKGVGADRRALDHMRRPDTVDASTN